jgi:hypothetical protein
MDNKYDEKILSSFGIRSTEANSPFTNGVFVVDPNKVINSENDIIPRYVKQEDLVMYANLTARLNPDNAIIQDGTDFNVVTIGQIGVNFMNPLKEATKNNDGTINFDKKKNKGVFTTDWSDFFTTNTNQESFFDPETFGITSIDVSHNASMTPIIKIEFVDVQGRTLLERGNDPTNPYNIFYRFPYPLFTLTIKGYYGKGIEYPLSMTKTSTTFDSSTGNYIIRAEFLSRTFSIYNNFLMVYAYLAPYMYRIGDEGSNDYLGKRLLKGLYQKQNKKYEKEYNVTSEKIDGKWVVRGPDERSKNEFRKHQFTKYPSIMDMIRTSNVLGNNELAYDEILKTINNDRSVALGLYSKLEDTFSESLKRESSVWGKLLNQNKRTPSEYYLKDDLINRLNNGVLPNLKSETMVNEIGQNRIDPYRLIRDYSEIVDEQIKLFSGEDYKTTEGLNISLKQNIINEIKLKLTASAGFKNEISYSQKLDSNNLKTIFNDDLILFNNTSSTNIDDLSKVYFSNKFFIEVHKIITSNLIFFFEKVESVTEDQLFFQLKEKIGFVPNIDNVIRILMNNMQVFLTLLNLSALNSFRQISDSDSRKKIQSLFGEYEIDLDNPDIQKFYPFPNYFQKELDANSNTYVFKKTYPGNAKTVGWFEVQFTEEIFRALKRMKEIGAGALDASDDESQIYNERLMNRKALNVSNQVRGLISSLLVINNLKPYDTQQTPIETVYEFVDKLMLFSGFANTATEKINTKLIDLLATHEFLMLEDSVRNAEKTSVSVFFNNIKNKITPTNNTETHYDVFARTMAGSANNSIALVNNINNTITVMNKLMDTQYTISDINSNKQKIEDYINSATNLETFKTLYDYDPLEYKSRKNPNTPERLHAVFFNGLSMHDQIEGNNPNLSTLAAEIKANYTEPSKFSDGYLNYYNSNLDLNKYPLDFKIDNKVSTNEENSNALAISVKTDVINPGLIANKKIKSETKYSKILI